MVLIHENESMKVNIQSLGFKAGEELEAYINTKLGKLTPNDHIIGANVVLFLGPDRATQVHYCEIRLEVPGNDPFVKEGAADFYQAVDATINKLQGILRKTKEKQVDAWHGKDV
jgi:putative sigma-54 modulation protein